MTLLNLAAQPLPDMSTALPPTEVPPAGTTEAASAILGALGQRISDAAFAGDKAQVTKLIKTDGVAINAKDRVS